MNITWDIKTNETTDAKCLVCQKSSHSLTHRGFGKFLKEHQHTTHSVSEPVKVRIPTRRERRFGYQVACTGCDWRMTFSDEEQARRVARLHEAN